MKNVIFYLSLVLLFASCGTSKFQKQKFTDLKPIKTQEPHQKNSVDYQSGELESKEVLESDFDDENGLNTYSQDNPMEATEKDAFNDDILKNSSIQSQENYSNEQEEVLDEKKVNRPATVLDEEDPEKQRKIEKLIKAILILLVVTTIVCFAEAALVIIFMLSGELIIFFAALFVCLLVMGLGVTTFMVALRLKNVKYKWREKVYVMLGIIGGWVWFGISLIVLYQGLINI